MVKEAYCTTEKSKALLGFKDRTWLVAGLEKKWTWSKAAWERYPERRDQPQAFNLELERGLYSYWR